MGKGNDGMECVHQQKESLSRGHLSVLSKYTRYICREKKEKKNENKIEAFMSKTLGKQI